MSERERESIHISSEVVRAEAWLSSRVGDPMFGPHLKFF
jgi:hypothetical protein